MEKKKIKPRQMKFLQKYVELGDLGKAYVAAGYTAKNKHSASQGGSMMLKKLDKLMDYREIFDSIGLTERFLAEKMKDLLSSPDQQVAARTLAVATKCIGWQREIIGLDEGSEIVIMTRKQAASQPASGGDSDDIQAKTAALPASQGIMR
ncbi:MAG: hypothetical protein PHT49_03330 [Desulfovibrionales bacterium]|nr:hypothetical protein [Desulfovibrionales bacterium]